MNGASEVRLVDLQSGKVLNRTKLAYEDFGEGLVKHQGRSVLCSQLTQDRQSKRKVHYGNSIYRVNLPETETEMDRVYMQLILHPLLCSLGWLGPG